MIHIYNRSHYEDILVPTVEDLFSKNIIEKRYDHINNFEELLTSDNNTRILKFYLHISPEKQKESLEERITNPQKYWKHNDGDRHSREKWDQYMSVYNKLFQHCDIVPWHIIPSDQKWYKINLITKIILKELESMDL
jgi:polyphosphate kinase 2 (PPK2 family)